MNYKETIELAQSKLEEARAIVSKPDASAEEKAKVPGLMAEAKQLKADADTLATIDREGGALAELAKTAGTQKSNPAEQAKKFEVWGEFLERVAEAERGGRKDARLVFFKDEEPQGNTRVSKDMSGETGAAGGYLIPEEFRAELMAVSAMNAVVRPNATVIPMRRRQISIPALSQTGSLPAGVPRWFGGLRAYWIGEGQPKPPSDAAFREINLAAKKLVVFTRATDELLDDAAISLEAFLSGPLGMAGAIAWMEDYAFFWGSGAAQPLGIFNSPALVTIDRNRTGAVTFNDLVLMMARHKMSRNSRWTFSQTVLPDIMRLEDNNGNLIWAGAINGNPPTLLGLPYDISEALPPVGTTGDILLADYRFYLIGDRQATTVESTRFEAWQDDKTSWRAVHRVDGQPWLDAPLTLQDGSTTISPFVTLSSDLS